MKRLLPAAEDEIILGAQLPLLAGKLLAAAVIAVYLILSFRDLGSAPIILLAMMALFLVYTSVHSQGRYYGASERGLTEYHLGRRLRHLDWDQILQIGLAQEEEMLRKKPMNKLIVTPEDCPVFVPGDDSSSEYLRQNDPQVFALPNDEATRQVLARWYGKLDY